MIFWVKILWWDPNFTFILTYFLYLIVFFMVAFKILAFWHVSVQNNCKINFPGNNIAKNAVQILTPASNFWPQFFQNRIVPATQDTELSLSSLEHCSLLGEIICFVASTVKTIGERAAHFRGNFYSNGIS